MRYTIRFGGFEIDADSPEAVKALLLSGNNIPAAAISPIAAGAIPTPDFVQERADRSRRAVIAGLRFMLDKTMVSSAAITKACGYRGTKAMAGFAHRVQAASKTYGLDFKDVYLIRRVGTTCYWSAGPKTTALIARLEEEAAGRR